MRRTLFLLGILVASLAVAQNRSVYTDLAAEKCKTLKIDEETSSSVQECPGFAGYRLIVEEGDLRQNITVIVPNKKEHSLELWTVVSSAFSSLGPRAEWRLRGSQPIALIVRYNASENPDNPNQITSYLAVVKITPGTICVTDRIPPGPNANPQAQRAADTAANRPCLGR